MRCRDPGPDSGFRPHPRPPPSPSLPSVWQSQLPDDTRPSATKFPQPRTHRAPDGPAHDDLRAEGEGGVGPVAVADARGENTGAPTGVQQDVMHHCLVALHQLGLKLDGAQGQSRVRVFLVKSYPPIPFPQRKLSLLPTSLCFSVSSLSCFSSPVHHLPPLCLTPHSAPTLWSPFPESPAH